MSHRSIWRRSSRLVVAAAIVASLALVPAALALAADTLDQSYTANDTVTFIHDVIVAGQTFTAGSTGSLNQLDLAIGRLENPGPLTVSVETVTGGVPTGVILASAAVPIAAVPNDSEVHTVSVSLPASLSTTGSQYAIVLAAPGALGDAAWIWAVDSLNGYGGGAALEGDTLKGTWTLHATDDRTFATYVDPIPCAAGFWSSTGYGPCTPADPGSFAAGPGATAQTPCSLGSYAPAAGSAACLAAPIGSYVDSPGAVAATPCPTGTTTSGTGATDLSACQPVSTTPLTITCAATPGVLSTPNNKLVAVSITVNTTGASGFQLVSVTANQGSPADIQGWTTGTADTTGLLRASRSGSGDRVYRLTYRATNAAGESAICVATVTVPHDQGHGGHDGSGGDDGHGDQGDHGDHGGGHSGGGDGGDGNHGRGAVDPRR